MPLWVPQGYRKNTNPPEHVQDNLLTQMLVGDSAYFGERVKAVEAQARDWYSKPVLIEGFKSARAHRDELAQSRLPRDVVQRMDKIAVGDFRTLKIGVDYDEVSSSAPLEEGNWFRTVKFRLKEPVEFEGRTIYAVRLKGVAFDPARLSDEFDLLKMYRLAGMGAPSGAVRMDFMPDRAGAIRQTVHINEPKGAEDLRETLGEARNHRLLTNAGEDVDYPICWYEYEDLVTPRGLRLGAMASGLTSKTRRYTGGVLQDQLEKYEPKVKVGDRGALGQWKQESEGTYLAYALRLAKMHNGGKGFFHESPHPGQFHFAEDGRIIMSDLHRVEPLRDMTYPQRIACIAMDLKPMFFYAARYDGLFAKYGFDFMGQAVRYFDRLRPEDKLTLGRSAGLGPSGRSRFEDVFEMAAEAHRPVAEYRQNPLIKAIMQQYPE